MTSRQTIGTILVGVIWVAGMTWLYEDVGTPRMIIWFVGGALFAVAWVWCMKRWGVVAAKCTDLPSPAVRARFSSAIVVEAPSATPLSSLQRAARLADLPSADAQG